MFTDNLKFKKLENAHSNKNLVHASPLQPTACYIIASGIVRSLLYAACGCVLWRHYMKQMIGRITARSETDLSLHIFISPINGSNIIHKKQQIH